MENEIFEKLRKYETHLRRGYYGGYIYGLYQKDFDELNEFYKKLGGRENLKYSCSACTLRLVRFVGKLYFEEVEKRKVAEREKEQEAVVEQPVEKPVVEEPVVEEPVVEEPVVEQPVEQPVVEQPPVEPIKKPRARKKKEAE